MSHFPTGKFHCSFAGNIFCVVCFSSLSVATIKHFPDRLKDANRLYFKPRSCESEMEPSRRESFSSLVPSVAMASLPEVGNQIACTVFSNSCNNRVCEVFDS